MKISHTKSREILRHTRLIYTFFSTQIPTVKRASDEMFKGLNYKPTFFTKLSFDLESMKMS